MVEKIFERIDSFRDEMINSLIGLIKIPAIHPKSGGEGEAKRANYLKNLIRKFGFDYIKSYDAKDKSVPAGFRPNMVATLLGRKAQTIWVVTHLDTVPPGDLNLWTTKPFEPVIKQGRIYGRGAEDNGQELIASLYACKALLDERIKPELSISLAFVSDEETGSEKGIKWLVNQGVFKKGDLILVPDGGNEKGTLIEVAEKSILWLKITTTGKQCHGSTPEKGINAFKAATAFSYRATNELYRRFNARDDLFEPPISTFEPTKKEANIPNVNTIPGRDVFYMDCRILPVYKIDDILKSLKRIASEVEKETNAKIKIEKLQAAQAAPKTPVDSEVVQRFKSAIKRVYGVDAKPGGIGGGTCAAIFRRRGFDAVVWAKLDNTCHAPNEYCRIDNLINDAKVYAALFLEKV